ncbi:MAG TPA: hypothetical protein DEB09_00480 [Candidatus Magasanikbacteria bacterium]|nr:hypothetical protein [Candidatus Magasanikbacteria bacterium]
MNKVIYIFLTIIAIFLLVIVGLRFFVGGDEDAWLCENGQWIQHGHPSEPMPDEICLTQKNEKPSFNMLDGVKNATYTIENEIITLVDGKMVEDKFEQEILPGEKSKNITELLSASELGDLDDNNLDDAVVILTQNDGGSGTFYYVSIALQASSTYYGYNAIFLGDRILPKDIEFRQGIIIVNYKDHADGQAMTDEPTLERQRYFVFEEGILKELNYKKETIELTSPKPASFISSPLEITGQARGTWFFEASFPIVLTNWDGLIIAEGVAQAQLDPDDTDGAGWMTTEFVPFKATLNFTADTTVSNRGALILKKDNPSGLPQNDDALEIPVFFE